MWCSRPARSVRVTVALVFGRLRQQGDGHVAGQHGVLGTPEQVAVASTATRLTSRYRPPTIEPGESCGVLDDPAGAAADAERVRGLGRGRLIGAGGAHGGGTGGGVGQRVADADGHGARSGVGSALVSPLTGAPTCSLSVGSGRDAASGAPRSVPETVPAGTLDRRPSARSRRRSGSSSSTRNSSASATTTTRPTRPPTSTWAVPRRGSSGKPPQISITRPRRRAAQDRRAAIGPRCSAPGGCPSARTGAAARARRRSAPTT